MRKVPTKNLKIGDWFLDEGIGLTGKFRVGKIKGYDIREWQEIDLNKGKITDLGERGSCRGVIDKDDLYVRVFNEKEIKALKEIKKRFLILKGLEEEKQEGDK